MTLIAGFLLGLVFLVETFVWYIRSMSEPAYRSKVISTSNIIMYLTRILLIGYQIILNYQIETGGNIQQVIFSGLVGMLFAFFAHNLIFGNESFIRIFWNIFYKSALLFRLINSNEYSSSAYVPNKNIKLNLVFMASLISTIALLSVYILPQIFATLFFDFRLTVSSVGQILSFLGMIVTLFVLDPQLFRMHDAGEIKEGFSYYLNGRLFGLVIASLVLIVLFFVA